MKIKFYFPSILLILLFHVSFISFPYWDGYNNFKYLIVAFVGIFLVFNFRIVLNKKYLPINFVLILYLLFVMISSYINKGKISYRNIFLSSIIFAIVIIEFFLMCEYYSIKEKLKEMINILFYLFLFYMIVTDVLLLFKPTLYIEHDMYYLIGNKFSVSYFHLQYLIIYLIRCKFYNNNDINSKIMFFIYCLITFVICMKIECSTGIIGLVFFVVFYCINNVNTKLLKKPMLILFTLVFSSSFFLLFSDIVKNKYVEYFIETILNEDITLTGRMTIYKNLSKVISGHLIFGYGYGSSYEVMKNLIGAPNTQNGLYECLFQSGIIATLLMLVLIYLVFKYSQNSKNKSLPIIMIYIFAVLSSVEITLGTTFLAWLALSLVYTDVSDKEFAERKIKLKITHYRLKFTKR